jgi:MoxR-like ATPase
MARAVREGVATRIVGLDPVVEQVLITLFTGGHALLEGVPGLAKTLLLSTTASLLDLSFRRIQFTPDLMPSDVTGSETIAQDAKTGLREFRYRRGPIFANVVLADEINRAPPKTQAALMEAMEEGQVTSLGVSRPLDRPFFVLATQNPIEQQGTYPLPVAQLDRFLFKVRLGYPSLDEEERILRLVSRDEPRPLAPVATRDDLFRVQAAVAEAPIAPELVRHAVRLAQATRPRTTTCDAVREYVDWGVGPRAAQGLVRAAKARALIHGRAAAEAGDLLALAPGIFRHRLILSYAAEADGIDADEIVRRVLEDVPAPGVERVTRPWWRRWLHRAKAARS